VFYTTNPYNEKYMEENKTLSFIERMKLRATTEKPYGGEVKQEEATVETRVCPHCGAGRAERDDLTECAYCGFTFMDVDLTDGIYISNNSL